MFFSISGIDGLPGNFNLKCPFIYNLIKFINISVKNCTKIIFSTIIPVGFRCYSKVFINCIKHGLITYKA